MQLDFSAAFDRVCHSALLFMLQAVGVGGSLLSVLRDFLSDRTMRVALDGSSSDGVNVVSGVLQGSVLGPRLFVLYTRDMFGVVSNSMFNYADDSTLVAVVKSPGDRQRVAQSLKRDLVAVSEWSRRWNMRLNPAKTKTMIVSKSRTVKPVPPASLTPHQIQLLSFVLQCSNCIAIVVLSVSLSDCLSVRLSVHV